MLTLWVIFDIYELGVNLKSGGASRITQPIIQSQFPENFMKMKTIGPRRGRLQNVDLPLRCILSLEDSRLSTLQSYRKSKTHLPRLVRVNNSKQIRK